MSSLRSHPVVPSFSSFRSLRVAATFAALVACGSDGSGKGTTATSAACASYCRDVCTLLANCPDVDTQDCDARCAAGLDAKLCTNAEPADRMTCSQAEQLVSCSGYCDALCERGATCGSFDESACRTGCLIQPPSICNPRSVEPRSCDELKPEISCYETIGDDSGGCFFSERFCTTDDACGEYGEPRKVCDLETNLCEPCTTDASCNTATANAEPISGSDVEDNEVYICNADKRCEQVECTEDAHCSEYQPACDLTTHSCVDCLDDDDCSGSDPHCDTTERRCVECTNDAHCDDGWTCDRSVGWCDPTL